MIGKIESLIDSITTHDEYYAHDIEKIMKEYAEWYAQKYFEKILQNMTEKKVYADGNLIELLTTYKEITDFELQDIDFPEHE